MITRDSFVRTLVPILITSIVGFRVYDWYSLSALSILVGAVAGIFYYIIAVELGQYWPVVEKIMLWSSGTPMYVHKGEVGVIAPEHSTIIIDEQKVH